MGFHVSILVDSMCHKLYLQYLQDRIHLDLTPGTLGMSGFCKAMLLSFLGTSSPAERWCHLLHSESEDLILTLPWNYYVFLKAFDLVPGSSLSWKSFTGMRKLFFNPASSDFCIPTNSACKLASSFLLVPHQIHLKAASLCFHYLVLELLLQL